MRLSVITLLSLLLIAIPVLYGQNEEPLDLSGEGIPKVQNEQGWYENYAEALQIARKKKLPVLINLSGSDWCGYCIRLDKAVFSQQEWKDYASGNLVLLEIDFPRRKEQSSALKKQNLAVRDHYKVEGYPAVILLDSSGKLMAQTGYKPGGVEKYISHIKELVKTE